MFFGTATLIGLFAGFILYFTSNYIDELLQLVPTRLEGRQPSHRKRHGVNIPAGLQPVAKPQKRETASLESHRDHGAQQLTTAFSSTEKLDTFPADWVAKDCGRRSSHAGLFSTTIIEEDDSGSGGF